MQKTGPKASLRLAWRFLPPLVRTTTFPTRPILLSRHFLNKMPSRVILYDLREDIAENEAEKHTNLAKYNKSRQEEATLVNLLETVQRRFSNRLVLVGFDLDLELTIIASHLSQIIKYFSSWVDLQEIASAVSKTKRPGLRDTLLALGFTSARSSIPGRNQQHSAGNDAVRQLAVLAGLLQFQLGKDAMLQLEQKQTGPKMRRFYHHRPRPKELYPFIARIRIEGKDLISVFPHLPRLMALFSTYQPTAIGISSAGNYG
ncbi:hypothetical protein GQ53DRAFT_53004 [Thozetella sp. PMI_491]|nr:hypothetical protein GQ53DRAFT_53004 [Thozetella sp. PMI_491]